MKRYKNLSFVKPFKRREKKRERKKEKDFAGDTLTARKLMTVRGKKGRGEGEENDHWRTRRRGEEVLRRGFAGGGCRGCWR